MEAGYLRDILKDEILPPSVANFELRILQRVGIQILNLSGGEAMKRMVARTLDWVPTVQVFLEDLSYAFSQICHRLTLAAALWYQIDGRFSL